MNKLRETDLPVPLVVWKRPTEVAESDRQAKRTKTYVSELVNELMHLGTAVGPGLRDGCPN